MCITIFFVKLKMLCVLSSSHFFCEAEDAVCIVWLLCFVMLKLLCVLSGSHLFVKLKVLCVLSGSHFLS